MRRAIILAACLVAVMAAPASAQAVYNPLTIQFDSLDHAIASAYKVEFWLQAADPVTDSPLSTHDLAKGKVTASGLAAPEPQFQANLADLTPLVGIPVGQFYVARMVTVGVDSSLLSARSAPSNPFRDSGCAPFGGQSASQMTLTVGALPQMQVGKYATVPVAVGGPSPVHAVSLDFVGDGQPAWYFVPFDARQASAYVVGPLKRQGRFEFTAHASDEMGCEVSNGVRVFVTIQ
jgi:hypothetical protein